MKTTNTGVNMTDLVKGPVMMSSLEIQQVITELAKDPATGVKEKRHDNILKDIKEQLNLDENHSSNVRNESFRVVKDYRGYISEIWLNQEETEVLVTGYSTPIRRAVLKKLRDKIAELESNPPPTTPSLPTDFISALEALLDSKKAEQKALAQAEYQDRALTTSQVRNGLLTKTVKKLKNELKGYAEFVSLNSFLSLNKVSTYDPVQKGRQSTKSIVAKLKKMGLENDAWTLKTFEDDEFPTTTFDPDFLANHIDFIMGEIERLIKGKR
jgi:hypothetical protein